MRKLLLLFLTSLSLLSILPTVEAAGYDQAAVNFSVQSAFFTSPSTDNGQRRFLAIGNFLDTTNDAYFRDSVATLKYLLPPQVASGILTAELLVYKYASSAAGNSPVYLQNENNIVLSSAILDNGDLDYDHARFFFTPDADADGKHLTLRLRMFTPQVNQGVAVCSGTVTDSICPTQYHPKLTITYVSNRHGKLERLMLAPAGNYNSDTDMAGLVCRANVGCQLNYVVDYRDPDHNAQLKLVSDGQTTELPLTGDMRTLALADGSWNLAWTVQDGSQQQTLATREFMIDTTAPGAAEWLGYTPHYTRAGAELELREDPAADHFQVIACQDITTDECIPLEVATHGRQLKLAPGIPATAQAIRLEVVQYDAAGNVSEPTSLRLPVRLDQTTLSQLKLQHPKLSPRNADKHFDEQLLNYFATERGKLTQVRLRGSLERLISKDQPYEVGSHQELLSNTLLAELPDGNYELDLAAQDSFGYALASHQPLRFSIDNTPPRFSL